MMEINWLIVAILWFALSIEMYYERDYSMPHQHNEVWVGGGPNIGNVGQGPSGTKALPAEFISDWMPRRPAFPYAVYQPAVTLNPVA